MATDKAIRISKTTAMTRDDFKIVVKIRHVLQDEVLCKRWNDASEKMIKNYLHIIQMTDKFFYSKHFYTIIMCIIFNFDIKKFEEIISSPDRQELYCKIVEEKNLEEYYARFTSLTSYCMLNKAKKDVVIPNDGFTPDNIISINSKIISARDEFLITSGNLRILYLSPDISALAHTFLHKASYRGDYYKLVTENPGLVQEIFAKYHAYEFYRCSFFMKRELVMNLLHENPQLHTVYRCYMPGFWKRYTSIQKTVPEFISFRRDESISASIVKRPTILPGGISTSPVIRP